MQHRLAFEIVRAAKYAALTIISADRNLARLTRPREPSHSVISYEVLAQALDSETGIDGLDLKKELGSD